MSSWHRLRAALIHDRNIAEPVRVSAVYLVVAPSCHVLGNAIGSLSEYRFPHPLLTTVVHLSLALAALVALSAVARALVRSQSRGRSLSSSAVASAPATPLGSALASLGHVRLSGSPLTAWTVSATLASIVGALLESRGTKISSVQFWAAARLSPLGLALILTGLGVSGPGGRGASRWPWALGLLGLLLVGPGLEWTAVGEAYVCAGGYALGATGWIWAVRAAQNEAQLHPAEGDRRGPTLALHLALSLAMLAVPLLLSGELKRASESGHFGFFTEVGFWAQELGLALCGLGSLASFWSVVTVLSPVSALSVVAVKEFLLPTFYHALLSNPLESAERGPALSRTQQWIGLVLLGGWTLAELVFEAGQGHAAGGPGVANKVG